jgi:hypothetical protein
MFLFMPERLDVFTVDGEKDSEIEAWVEKLESFGDVSRTHQQLDAVTVDLAFDERIVPVIPEAPFPVSLWLRSGTLFLFVTQNAVKRRAGMSIGLEVGESISLEALPSSAKDYENVDFQIVRLSIRLDLRSRLSSDEVGLAAARSIAEHVIPGTDLEDVDLEEDLEEENISDKLIESSVAGKDSGTIDKIVV